MITRGIPPISVRKAPVLIHLSMGFSMGCSIYKPTIFGGKPPGLMWPDVACSPAGGSQLRPGSLCILGCDGIWDVSQRQMEIGESGGV